MRHRRENTTVWRVHVKLVVMASLKANMKSTILKTGVTGHTLVQSPMERCDDDVIINNNSIEGEECCDVCGGGP